MGPTKRRSSRSRPYRKSCERPGTYLDGDCRFWFVYRDDVPVLAFEQSEALAWVQHHDEALPVMKIYKQSRRHVLVTALKILLRVDDV